MLGHVSPERGRRGRRRRLLAAAAATGLAVASLTAGSPSASANPDVTQAHVDSEVYEVLANEDVAQFFVYLTETADLSGARSLDSKPAKSAHVYEQLTTVAQQSQADLRAELDERGIEYTPYWIANTLLVTGDSALVDELAGRADVARIEPHRDFALVEPVEIREDTDATINQVEWGVANLNADDVWGQFGVTGEGIVVGSIDTGVQYDHPAVADQYRGAATGSHDYNWFDPAGVCSSTAPCDNNGHGTHTVGTMVGDDGGSNQIGVAPGAQWIAAKGCESNSCSSSSLLAAGQWMAAPTDANGNNPDPSMTPDVVNNSWGGGRGDTWYQATINAWVSAGIFPMFSAGNAGPSCNTANSPGDNLNAYAIGAYDSGNNIASFSSRGYSGVDGSTIKPNASAPGVSVRSSVPTNSYASISGTSMASPHAAGVVALIWSAESSLRGDIPGTRAVLDTTARDTSASQCGGTAANNNVFGEGRLDALAAVTAATGGDPPPPPPPPELAAAFSHSCSGFFIIWWCSFDASPSTGEITGYSWDFGDGSSGTGQTVTNFYSSTGTYSVTLTVTGDGGATASTTEPVTVS